MSIAGFYEGMPELRRDFLPEHLRPLLDSTGFDGTIAVQARQTLAETKWLLALAEANPWIQGVVGWVDLRAPDLNAQLARFGSHPKLVGVRHVMQDEPDDHFVLQPEFRRGIAQLQEFDLTYDLLLFPRQLPAAIRLASEFPGQPFVLDHLAKPLVREGKLSPWREDLRHLADLPNVYCKLSGMVTEAKWKQWRPDEFRPYLDWVLECFGPGRIMIGSDWPVCTVSSDYPTTIGLVLSRIACLPLADRESILGTACARFYGLTCQA
ncbi:MAG: amidohydrolase family protein [Verrucomicrobiota bacterium]